MFLRDKRANSQMLTMAMLLPFILVIIGFTADIAVVNNVHSWVNEAAIQGARVGSRSATPEEDALEAVLRFGSALRGWQLGPNLAVNTTITFVDGQELLNVNVHFTFPLISGRSHTLSASSSVFIVDTH